MLFRVPLMAGGRDAALVARWRELVAQAIPERRMRGNAAGIALVLAGLVGRRVEWDRGLEGFEMTESQVVNEWIGRGATKGALLNQRKNLLEALALRLPGATPDEVVRLINEQDNMELLNDWLRAALRAYTFEQFMDVLKR